PLRPEVIMRRAETLFSQKQYPAAEKWFASAAAAKDFGLADQAQMRQAASLYEQKKYAEAAALYEVVPEKFPKSSLKSAAALATGNCYYLAGQPEKAKKWFKLVLSAGDASAV